MTPARKLFFLLIIFCIQFTPALQSTGSDYSIPALCYHKIVPQARGLFDLSVAAFRDQLSILKSRGYTGINTSQLHSILTTKTRLAEGKPVLITFDDGYRSVYDYAFPVMKELGFVGVVCIYPKFIGARGAMTWEMIRHLIDAGWSVESHSMTHPNLLKDAPTEHAARKRFHNNEIFQSRQVIIDNTGHTPMFIAWPYGIYSPELVELARKAGYQGALTVDSGANYPGLDPFLVKRQVVYRTDDRQKFLVRFGMGPLKVTDHSPLPGEILQGLTQFSFVLPGLEDYNLENYVLNVKVSGGAKLDFTFDQESRRVRASLARGMPKGHHFIDVYLRDRHTGITGQHGWLFNIGNY